AIPVLAPVLENGRGNPLAGEAVIGLVRAHLELGDLAALPGLVGRIVPGDPYGGASGVLQLVWESLRGTRNESVWSSILESLAAVFAAKRYRDAAAVQELVAHMSGSAADRHDYAVLRLDAGMKEVAERLYRVIAADTGAPESERSRAWNALALLLRSEGQVGE